MIFKAISEFRFILRFYILMDYSLCAGYSEPAYDYAMVELRCYGFPLTESASEKWAFDALYLFPCIGKELLWAFWRGLSHFDAWWKRFMHSQHALYRWPCTRSAIYLHTPNIFSGQFDFHFFISMPLGWLHWWVTIDNREWWWRQ